MGLFKDLFGKSGEKPKKEQPNVPWKPLVSVHQLDEIVEKSKDKTQVIFKHSTTCGISRMVLNTFNTNYDYPKDQFDLYYLDLHSFREVSNETGIKFQVVHQSPQLLVIRNGVVVAHDSHGGINSIDLNSYV
ncbi:bacillithiol system redox-active protein YtxJ [Maribacter sp. ANRC-HE7]|uniref:Bacillithiol system redox-active protein YtxJ n=1 Tax=Maribacter aquimaris TaxID=2737171 RepID=A0ABR7UVN2_9FLAO|nr:bacillithiol system redox-active protein YtxJ [Maribacter aquimaris]MBD0776517.1 bacillithiol system redox-active protein YtxJ [Maribacter aquimaris]